MLRTLFLICWMHNAKWVKNTFLTLMGRLWTTSEALSAGVERSEWLIKSILLFVFLKKLPLAVNFVHHFKKTENVRNASRNVFAAQNIFVTLVILGEIGNGRFYRFSAVLEKVAVSQVQVFYDLQTTTFRETLVENTKRRLFWKRMENHLSSFCHLN